MKRIKYYKDGNYEIYNEINGMKQGKANIYFKDSRDKIKEEFNYVNDLREGEAFLIFQNGIEKRYYKNGKLWGLAVKYLLTGEIRETMYVDGKKDRGFIHNQLKNILGMPYEKINYPQNELSIDKENDYKIFIEEAQAILTKYANLNKN